MTSNSKLAFIAAALLGAVAVMGPGETPTGPDVTAATPFWQLQGAGPSSGRETGAMTELRMAGREAATQRFVMAAR